MALDNGHGVGHLGVVDGAGLRSVLPRIYVLIFRITYKLERNVDRVRKES